MDIVLAVGQRFVVVQSRKYIGSGIGSISRRIVRQRKNYRFLKAIFFLFKVGDSSSSSAVVSSGEVVSTPLPLVVTLSFFATRAYLVREGVDGCLAREGVDRCLAWEGVGGCLAREGVDGPGSALVVMGGLGMGSSLSRLGLALSLMTLGCKELEGNQRKSRIIIKKRYLA